MSTKASLPTPEDVLERPVEEDKPRGLIPRSSLFWFIAIFFVLLLGFAARDLMFAPTPGAGAEAKGDGAKAEDDKAADSKLAVDRVGPPPAAADVAELAEMQQAKAAELERASKAKAATPVPSGVIAQGVQAPADAPMGSSTTTPVGGVATSVATAERKAMSAESGLVLLDGNESTAGGTGQAAQSGSRQPNLDQLRAQLDVRAPQIPPDNSAELIKTVAQLQSGNKPPSGSRDDQFLRSTAEQTTAPATEATAPASPWMVFQGTRIPIVTREAVNSDLPGQITALSTAPIFDSINQCAVMVPQGTKFIGSYSADIRAGQQRVLMAFRRMILPDGRSVELGGAMGVDQVGRSGMEGDVDNHFLQMFGYGFAIAWIADRSGSGGAGVTVTQPGGASTTTTVAGQVLADTSRQILSRNSQMPPTLTLDPGQKMYVTVTRDISLKPISKARCL